VIDDFFSLLVRNNVFEEYGGRLPFVPTAPVDVDPLANLRLPLLFVVNELVVVMAASGTELLATEFGP
jgi:hypothetical protein